MLNSMTSLIALLTTLIDCVQRWVYRNVVQGFLKGRCFSFCQSYQKVDCKKIFVGFSGWVVGQTFRYPSALSDPKLGSDSLAHLLK